MNTCPLCISRTFLAKKKVSGICFTNYYIHLNSFIVGLTVLNKINLHCKVLTSLASLVFSIA